MSAYMDRIMAQVGGGAAPSKAGQRSDYMQRIYSQFEVDPTAKYGINNPHPYVHRANARLEAMGAFQAVTPNLRAQILEEERMKDEGGQSEFAVDHYQRGLENLNKRNPAADYASGVMQNLSGIGESLVGVVAPGTAEQMRFNREAQWGTPQGMAGKIGGYVGMAGSVAATMASGGALLGGKVAASAARGMKVSAGLFGAQGVGGVRQNVARLRAEGQEISWQAEWGAAVATGAFEGLSGALSYKITSGMGRNFAKKLSKLAPHAAAVYQFGGRSILIGFLKKALPGMIAEGTEESLTQLATNAADMLAEITPGLRFTEGALEAGLTGAALAPFLGGVSLQQMGNRSAAANKGRPTPPGLASDDNGADTLSAIPDAIEAADPVEGRTGLRTPTRSNGPAHLMTKEMYLDDQHERGLNRADRIVEKVSHGNARVAEALYKGLGIAPPNGILDYRSNYPKDKAQTEYRLKQADFLRRIFTMGASKAKPKTMESKKTVDAVVKALRAADPNQSLADAKVEAERMVVIVAKYTRNSRFMDVALAHHSRLVQQAIQERKDVPQEVVDEYSDPATVAERKKLDEKPIVYNDRQIDKRVDTWDNDAYGHDEVAFGGEENQIDLRPDPTDIDQSHNWVVMEDPAMEDGEYAIFDENGEVMDGPYDTKAEADYELEVLQDTNGRRAPDGPDWSAGRVDGWAYEKGKSEQPPQRSDGLPPTAVPEGPNPTGSPAGKAIGQTIKNLLQPIATRVKQIDKAIFGRLMSFETKMAWETASTIRFVTDWGNMMHRSFKKHGKEKAIDLRKQMHLLLSNGKFDDAYALMMEYAPSPEVGLQLVNGMKSIRVIIAKLQKRQEAVGIKVNEIENYFPRAVKDYDAYMLRQGKERKSSILKKIEAAQEKADYELTKDDKIRIINEDLQGYGEQFLPQSVRHGAQRTVAFIDEENADLYETYDVALVQYLGRTIQGIHAAKFFGRGEDNLSDSIGRYVEDQLEAGQITQDQLQELKSLLTSRFVGGQRSPHMFNRVVRDIGYISTIANAISAVTQLGDIALSLVENGMINSVLGVGHMFKVGRGMKTPGGFRAMWQIGVTKVSAEFGDAGGLPKYLNFVMKYSGFKFMDGVGKTLHLNSSYIQMKRAAQGMEGTHVVDGKTVRNKEDSKAYRKVEEEWRPILGVEFDQTMADLRSGQMTDNVRMVLFTKLSKIQPISLSEFPTYYLDHPNGRIFYMLKSFTIKQFDYLKQESFDHMKRGWDTDDMGEMLKGLTGLLKIAFVFMAFFGVDMLKDFLMQRETAWEDIPDSAISTALKMMGTSKYVGTKMNTEGFGMAAFSTIAPPTQWATDIYTDIKHIPEFVSRERSLSELRAYRNAPVLGKWIYYGIGHGNTLDAKVSKTLRRSDRKEVRAEAMKAMLDGDTTSAYIFIEHYNDDRPDDMERLTMKGIRNSIKRARKKERDDASGKTERDEARRLAR